MNTLKQEEIYCSEYKDIDDLRANLSHFLETYYNIKRLHSALGYQSPEAFEQKTARSPAASQTAALQVMSFRRHEEIYPSDGRS